MKTYNSFLTKRHSNTQLGHLYEHIVVHSINTLFYEAGYFKAIDYALTGTTYSNGIITLDFEAYNKEAWDFFRKKITDVTPEFSENAIITNLFQIIAEEHHLVSITDTKSVLAELKSLHDEPWSDLDDTTFLSAHSTIHSKPIQLIEDENVTTKDIYFSFDIGESMSGDTNKIIPFLITSRYLLYTIGWRIADSFGLYTSHIEVEEGGTRISLVARFAADTYHHNFDTRLLTDAAAGIYEYMLGKGAVDRISHSLGTTSYQNDMSSALDPSWLIEELGLVVGSRALQDLSTVETPTSLFKNIHPTVSIDSHS